MSIRCTRGVREWVNKVVCEWVSIRCEKGRVNKMCERVSIRCVSKVE